MFSKDINVPELVAYGKEKGVGLILWVSWLAVDKNFDTIFQTYRDWGVAGMKIDFMDRSDQYMVNFYDRTARKAHQQELKLDFLGEGEYKLTAIQDGINAHQLAIDHKVVEQTVTKDSVINIKMVDEGGFVCRIEPVK